MTACVAQRQRAAAAPRVPRGGGRPLRVAVGAAARPRQRRRRVGGRRREWTTAERTGNATIHRCSRLARRGRGREGKGRKFGHGIGHNDE